MERGLKDLRSRDGDKQKNAGFHPRGLIDRNGLADVSCCERVHAVERIAVAGGADTDRKKRHCGLIVRVSPQALGLTKWMAKMFHVKHCRHGVCGEIMGDFVAIGSRCRLYTSFSGTGPGHCPFRGHISGLDAIRPRFAGREMWRHSHLRIYQRMAYCSLNILKRSLRRLWWCVCDAG